MLDNQRFYCKHCHCTFIAESNEINKYCNISNNTKLSIKLDLMNKISEKDIVFRNKDIDLFIKIISSKHNNISDYMKTTLKTYNEFKPFIINSLKFEYNNGLIEGTNNLIKYIKRIASVLNLFIISKLEFYLLLVFINMHNKKEVRRPPINLIYH